MFKAPKVCCLRYQEPWQWQVLVDNPFYCMKIDGMFIDPTLMPFFYVDPNGKPIHSAVAPITLYDTEKKAVSAAVAYVYRKILFDITDFLLS
jgi:hypothetical protein